MRLTRDKVLSQNNTMEEDPNKIFEEDDDEFLDDLDLDD